MTKIARISDNQTVTLEDFRNLAQMPRDALDALIAAAIETGQSYAGGTVTKSGVTSVAVQSPLYLLKGSALYTNAEGTDTAIDLLNLLPTAGNRRIVAILAQAQEFDDLTRPRDFEIDGTVYPPLMDPQGTATIVWRKATVAIQAGDQAPSPSRPIIDGANTVLAWVTLSSTEVVLVEQNIEARISTLGQVGGRVRGLEAFEAEARPTIDGLRADVAKLVASSKGKSDRGFQAYLLEQLARLNERVGVPQDASYSATNYFLDTSDSETTHVQYVAKVEEGMRFANDGRDRLVLSLETPGDTRIQTTTKGMVLPKWEDRTILSVLGKDSEVALSNAGSQTIEYVLKTVSRTRKRYGPSFLVCSNNAWWDTGRFDSVKGVFERAGEVFDVEIEETQPGANLNDPDHRWYRVSQIFEDTYEEPYWSRITVPASFTGNVCGNTFLMPRSTWVTAVRLGFSRVDAGGDVRVLLCEAKADGSPDYSKALADVTVAAANLKRYPELTSFPLPATYLEGGKRYAWASITGGNHWLAMVEGNKYAQGTFFTSTDGVWSQGNLSQDGCFEIIGASFSTPRIVVNLNNWSLAGGITDLDLDLEQVVPQGTSITYEIQVGPTWYAVGATGVANPLIGLPASVNARMVLLGTTDVMPGVRLGSSFVTKTRPRTNSTHISIARQAPSNVDEIRVVSILEHYVEANHDCVVKLLTGATFTTELTASSTTDEILADGSVRRTSNFTGFAATNRWKIKTSIATVSALSVFHVAEQTDIAFPA